MATTITGINQSKVINQLDTYNHTTLASTVYKVTIRLTEQPPSGVSIVIKNNSSTIVTSTTPSNTQSHIELQCLINCTANDVIGVIISSSSANDQLGNAIKAILTINQGSN